MTNRERMKLKRLKSKGERFENEFVLEREGERERAVHYTHEGEGASETE